jgi:hypothetical protein
MLGYCTLSSSSTVPIYFILFKNVFRKKIPILGVFFRKFYYLLLIYTSFGIVAKVKINFETGITLLVNCAWTDTFIVQNENTRSFIRSEHALIIFLRTVCLKSVVFLHRFLT